MVFSPLPLAGEGGEGGRWHTIARHFVEALALTRTLSHKREREYTDAAHSRRHAVQR
ncbi:hypothetical protein CBM2592_B10054 [Cupriavidus taiwanensis]|nr:hypothetical protein CBM2588_B10053 [Cupriavidus taiwanensis]SOY59790.1 hypothetical protein CBM2592_B10054 [Cupriavidus taiwanensis]SOY91830.1 hypothetical protein CBM2591_B10054 [Cupriavidus taiwanensis]SOZ28555.1 hypothetical protein CBM2608_B140455 [Cupriavidus taiwanensis]SOZ73491.1 hypothetical protein CBM2617_B190054 [Cupriavidus taiwanensis]